MFAAVLRDWLNWVHHAFCSMRVEGSSAFCLFAPALRPALEGGVRSATPERAGRSAGANKQNALLPSTRMEQNA